MHSARATNPIRAIGGKRGKTFKPRRMLCVPLLFMLLSLVIIALAYSRPSIFAMKYGDSGSDDENPLEPSNSTSSDPEENGLTGNNGEWDEGAFSMGFFQPIATVWASDALGNDKELFEPSDSMYASVQATGQTVTFYVTVHHETWTDGEALTDVSGGAKMIALNPSGVQTVEVWVPILLSGCYDIVLDANNNGVFDPCVDATDMAQVRLINIIPEVPLGPIVASFGLIAGVAGFAGFKRSISKRQR